MRLRYDDPTPLRFVLERTEDETGISGTGKVASGCCFPDGSAVVHWNTDIFTTTVFKSMEDVEALHGHGGKTRVVWVDQPTRGSVKT